MTRRASVAASLMAIVFVSLQPPGGAAAAAEESGLTRRQQTRLGEGKVVLTRVGGPTGAADGAGKLVGLMQVTTPDAAIWAAVLDFDAIAAETPGLRSASVVEGLAGAADDRIVVAYELAVFGRTIRYQLVHWLDTADRTVRWSLDPSASNDVGQLDGVIALSGEGGQTTIRYSSIVDTGMRLPRPVEEWLIGTSLTGYLRSLRARAQASASEGRAGLGPTTAPSASSASSP